MHLFNNRQWTKLKQNKIIVYKGIKEFLLLYKVITALFI